MNKIVAIIGARPQFIKHAPIEIAAKGVFEMVTVHTGQHYDHQMSEIFFHDLKLDIPKYNLGAGGGTHAVQTGKMMIDIEPILLKERPEYVLVYGDTNSTIAGALTAAKLNIPVIHIEAGLRSFNNAMPEEINRKLTDHLSTYLFTPTAAASLNLKNEGITKNVFDVGDVMFDMLLISQNAAPALTIPGCNSPFCYATIHRPYNTDNADRMRRILSTLETLPFKVLFSVHPRTMKMIRSTLDPRRYGNINFSEPLSYFESIYAIGSSKMVITDSGGLQKEAYMLHKKCITVRSETEWTETLINGWNTLIFEDIEQITVEATRSPGEYVSGFYGDGTASLKIVNQIKASSA